MGTNKLEWWIIERVRLRRQYFEILKLPVPVCIQVCIQVPVYRDTGLYTYIYVNYLYVGNKSLLSYFCVGF